MRWSSPTARAYGELGEQGHERILGELFRELPGSHDGARVLDFGCGPGRLTAMLTSTWRCRVVAVDQSPEMVAVAREAVSGTAAAERVRFTVGDERCLAASGGFDLAVCSLALMMSGTRRRLHRVCRALVQSLAPAGQLLAVVTHPCFRSRDYGTFHYDLPPDYDYWRLGEPYRVVLTPSSGSGRHDRVVITDVHWTLEAYVEALVAGGGLVSGLRELPADRTDRGEPVGPPAYLALLVRRGPDEGERSPEPPPAG